jgi:2-(1,2-epoxy-1,2-dihydrophenyl)acetyl-CoA isomerase
MSAAESLYRSMVADGDDPEAPRRIRVEHRGDRAVVNFDEPDRPNELVATLVRQVPRTP